MAIGKSAILVSPRIRTVLAISSVAAIALSGCAANQLRLEGASAVSSASTAVVELSRSSLAHARERRVRANAVLIASDPSCFPTTTVYIRVPHQGPQGRLCAASAVKEPGVDLIALDMRPISETSLQPTLALTAALADYSAALTKIVTEPNPDISKELSSIAEKAGEAKSIADGLLGTQLPDAAKPLATDQAKVALDLLQMVATLSAEAEKVRALRNLVTKNDPEVARISAELSEQVTDWLAFSAAPDARLTTNRLQAYYRKSSGTLTFDQRLAFVELINTARADEDALTARASAIQAAIKLLGDARVNLARRLQGRITEAEKREIARLEQERVLAALKLLARAAILFV